MNKGSLKDSFIKHCEKNKFEKNKNQIEIINLLEDFIKPKNKIFNFFSNPNEKIYISTALIALIFFLCQLSLHPLWCWGGENWLFL